MCIMLPKEANYRRNDNDARLRLRAAAVCDRSGSGGGRWQRHASHRQRGGISGVCGLQQLPQVQHACGKAEQCAGEGCRALCDRMRPTGAVPLAAVAAVAAAAVAARLHGRGPRLAHVR